MQNSSENSWLSKSPLKSFNVWMKESNGDSATLVISSGAVYRKQTILSTEEVEKEGAPPPEGEDPETVTKLRIDYAAECYACDSGSIKVTSKSFPMIVGVLDGNLVYTDLSLETFNKVGSETVADDSTGAAQTDAEDEGYKDKMELEKKQESTSDDSGNKKTNPVPNVIRFFPLLYVEATKDAFDNIILRSQKQIVESNIVLGKDVFSKKEDNPVSEPKPEGEAAAKDPCDDKEHKGSETPSEPTPTENGGGSYGNETPSTPGNEEPGKDVGDQNNGGDADPCDTKSSGSKLKEGFE